MVSLAEETKVKDSLKGHCAMKHRFLDHRVLFRVTDQNRLPFPRLQQNLLQVSSRDKHSEECDFSTLEWLQRLHAADGLWLSPMGQTEIDIQRGKVGPLQPRRLAQCELGFCGLMTLVPTLNDHPVENGCDWSVFQVAFLVVLTIFGIQSHGYEVYNIISPSNKGGNVQETVTIDNEKNTAIINIHAGLCSSTTIFDYKHGYIASRVLSRRACFILKMDHKAIPALDQLKRFIYERQAMNSMFSNKYTWVKYNPLKSLLTEVDWFLLGSPIQQLCDHIPLYKGEVVEETDDVSAGGCVKTGLLGILGISICADIHI
ncbi:gastrokine-2 [Cynocephalus volans]|uniref:gastrokine-2 n=1 Tax=Cynocephalus volans TaxID=110931 RepID=UPI002FC605CB